MAEVGCRQCKVSQEAGQAVLLRTDAASAISSSQHCRMYVEQAEVIARHMKVQTHSKGKVHNCRVGVKCPIRHSKKLLSLQMLRRSVT
jgi:hypothetical protein